MVKVMEFNITSCKIEVTKHFRNKYMKHWGWDFVDLRQAIQEAYAVERVGKKKYEIYSDKKGSKKIICAYYKEFETLVIISGSEGKR